MEQPFRLGFWPCPTTLVERCSVPLKVQLVMLTFRQKRHAERRLPLRPSYNTNFKTFIHIHVFRAALSIPTFVPHPMYYIPE